MGSSRYRWEAGRLSSLASAIHAAASQLGVGSAAKRWLLPDDETYECGCERIWFVEKNDAEAVFVVRTEDGDVPLDRRPFH